MDPKEGCSRYFLEDEEDFEEVSLGATTGEDEGEDGPEEDCEELEVE